MARVLVVSDTQIPFDHDDYLPFLKEVRAKYRTSLVVHVGDEVDACALSDYDKDPDGMSAGDELLAAIERLKPYYRAFPEMRLCESNHTQRILKKAFKSGIPRDYLKEFKDVIGAPWGWRWAAKWEIDNIVYLHGVGYAGTMGAINAAKDNLKSCVIGHLHADAGLLFWSNGDKTLFGMNVGSGINQKSYAFNYGKDHRKKSILSCGVVMEGRPHLILMNVKNGRWDGEI